MDFICTKYPLLKSFFVFSELRTKCAQEHGECDTPKHVGTQGATFLEKFFLDFRRFSSENPQKTDFSKVKIFSFFAIAQKVLELGKIRCPGRIDLDRPVEKPL